MLPGSQFGNPFSKQFAIVQLLYMLLTAWGHGKVRQPENVQTRHLFILHTGLHFFFYHKHPNAAGFSTGGSSFSIILTLTTSDYPRMPKYREILVPSTQEQLRKTTAKEESARTVLLQSHQAEQWISAEHVRTTASPPSERYFSGTQQQDLTQRNT